MRFTALIALHTFLGLSLLRADTFNDVAARAQAAREANDSPQAIELYRQAVQLNPQWEQGWWFLGSLLYDGDQYKDARDALRKFVQLAPNASPGWGLLGLCEFETHQYDQSLVDIQQAIRLGAARQGQMAEVLRFHEAVLLTVTGKFEKALPVYARLLRNTTPSKLLTASIGLAALHQPLLAQNIPQAQQDLYILAGTASSDAMRGDIKGAQSAFDNLLTQYGQVENVHLLYANFVLANSTNKSIEELKKELALHPANAAAGAMLAWILYRDGAYTTGLPYAQAAVNADPQYPMAQLALGRLLVETGSDAPGIQHLELAEKMDDNNLEVHMSLATAYARTGRPADARRERAVSLELTKVSPAIAR